MKTERNFINLLLQLFKGMNTSPFDEIGKSISSIPVTVS